MENGILNSDGTPNESTAQRLGWILEEREPSLSPFTEEKIASEPVRSEAPSGNGRLDQEKMEALKAKAPPRVGR